MPHWHRTWELVAYSDSDYAGEKETRRSVYGYFMYFCGVPIAWRNKGIGSVVLSTTEAEYIALSQVVKELKFIIQLLQTMKIQIEIPITVYVDNVGAIWLSNNHTTSRHVHIRTAFAKEYQEEGKILIKFVKSKDNDADINTKNTANVTFQKHQKRSIWDKEEIQMKKISEKHLSINQKNVENIFCGAQIVR